MGLLHIVKTVIKRFHFINCIKFMMYWSCVNQNFEICNDFLHRFNLG